MNEKFGGKSENEGKQNCKNKQKRKEKNNEQKADQMKIVLK